MLDNYSLVYKKVKMIYSSFDFSVVEAFYYFVETCYLRIISLPASAGEDV